MKIRITNMRPGKGRQLAIYEAQIADGWTIRECLILRRDDGGLSALTPVIRNGIKAVDIPERLWADFIGASMVAYRKWAAHREETSEPNDAGTRRVLSAEQETCALAGI